MLPLYLWLWVMKIVFVFSDHQFKTKQSLACSVSVGAGCKIIISVVAPVSRNNKPLQAWLTRSTQIKTDGLTTINLSRGRVVCIENKNDIAILIALTAEFLDNLMFKNESLFSICWYYSLVLYSLQHYVFSSRELPISTIFTFWCEKFEFVPWYQNMQTNTQICIYFNTDTTLLWLWCKTKKFRPKTFLGKEIALLRPIFNLSRCDGSVHRAFSVLVLKFFGSQNTIIVTWKWSKCQTQKHNNTPRRDNFSFL